MRAARPGALTPRREEETAEESLTCPFCEGREEQTPPETYALAPGRRAADSPGWLIRVVPNKFPALGRQEVVVHSPRHARSIADLTGEELEGTAAAWQARAGQARGEGFGYVHALVNEGQAAGASLAHSHSQLVWLAGLPPALEREQEHDAGGCVLCRALEQELADGSRVVLEEDGLALLCPYAGRAPYELLVAPLACEADAYASERLGAALALLARAVGLLRAVEGPVPLNAWLHTSGLGAGGGHWHLEALPRLTVLAGLELGAGLYVNPLPPETAAERLRSV